MSTPEQNKALVRRFYAALDNGDADAIDELVAEEYLDHHPPHLPDLSPGRAGVLQAFDIFRTATPGIHEIEQQVAEGDLVVTRLTARGHHTGDLPGVPATGNELTMQAVVVHRVEDGKLAEHWSARDDLGLMVQLGMVSLPPG